MGWNWVRRSDVVITPKRERPMWASADVGTPGQAAHEGLHGSNNKIKSQNKKNIQE